MSGEESADIFSAMNPAKRGTESLRPNRNAIYNAVIKRMVRESLEQKEEDFAIAHAQDSDAELLIYLRQCAAELRHSPWPREIVGWKYLTERFEDWNEMLKKAHLPIPTTPNKVSSFQLVIEETKYQKQVYRQRKEEKKAENEEIIVIITIIIAIRIMIS